ncbi:hypothetical protein [Bizionia sp.]|uniref:hypothetical protein n=1 Tax=Bizionia sp. TaxID=1954480 RepID=UPI003A959D18
MKNIDDFLLTKDVTVGQTKQWINNKDADSKTKLIDLIHHRFYYRYVKHLKSIDSGFLKMAVSCLMIEALESFRQGKKDTKAKGIGKQMFKDFFEIEQILFPGFKDVHADFYYSIRCGILHQAETNNGWRILRKNSLLDTKNKTINAKKFVEMLEKSLENYTSSLENEDFNSEIWNNAIFKLENVCENCRVTK